MKKNLLKIITAALFLAALTACNDPVFYMISKEPPKVIPLIQGSPTNFAIYKKAMYVASGERLYRFNGDWNIESPKIGRIVYLAASDEYFYAVILNSKSKGELLRTNEKNNRDNLTSWKTVDVRDKDNNKLNIQSVFAANGSIFVCAANAGSKNYSVYHSIDAAGLNFKHVEVADNSSVKKPVTNISFLRGVVSYDSDSFLICAGGIISASLNSSGELESAVALSAARNFIGIVDLGSAENNIIAISREGSLSKITKSETPNEETGEFKFSLTNINKNIGSSVNQKATGAVAVWTNNSNNLLLAGRQHDVSSNTSYTHGYVEIAYDMTEGIKSDALFKEPGKAPTTVPDYNTYVNSIGKNPVNFIIQTPAEIDSKMTVFASTQADGIWRLKDGQWNQQEE